MLELISTIALLCQVSTSGSNEYTRHSYAYINKNQLKCQKHYINCVNKKSGDLGIILKKCILEKKLDN